MFVSRLERIPFSVSVLVSTVSSRFQFSFETKRLDSISTGHNCGTNFDPIYGTNFGHVRSRGQNFVTVSALVSRVLSRS